MDNQNQNLGSVVYSFILFKGIALTLTGAILLFFPEATIKTLMLIIGVYWVIDGIATVVKSFNGRKMYKGWEWGIIAGSLAFLAGLVVLSGPSMSAIFTTTFLMWFVGISAIIYGVSEIVTGYRLPKGTGKSTLLWGGVISIVFGLIFLSSPYNSAVTIITILGAFAIAGGITLIIVGNRLKKAIKENYNSQK